MVEEQLIVILLALVYKDMTVGLVNPKALQSNGMQHIFHTICTVKITRMSIGTTRSSVTGYHISPPSNQLYLRRTQNSQMEKTV